jgi:hypothetical protein
MEDSYRRLVVRLREDRKTSWSKILIEGKTVHNPIPEHPDVCPFDCKKSPKVQVTHFLTRHHTDKSIGLFSCEGCPHLLFKTSIIPTDSLPLHSAETKTRVPTHSKMPPIEPIEDAVKVETKTTRILDTRPTDQTPMSDDYITLTRNTYNRLRGRGINLVCRVCGNPISVGQQYRTNSGKNKRYHRECWESLFRYSNGHTCLF